MKKIANTTGLLSLVLMLFMTVTFAQERKSLGDEIYSEYKTSGVDAALTKYHQLKKDTTTYEVSEYELNRIAYRIMNEEGDMDAAERIFRLNMEEYPRAANPYDSYGDYLVKKGSKEEAKEYFRKSLAISEISDIESERDQLFFETKGKLAKLENKDKQLDFLVGDWNIDATGYNEGKEAAKIKGIDKIKYDENANALFMYHADDKNQSEGVRIIAYDAVDDVFDVAYLNPHSLQGIRTSSMKMKPLGNDSYEFTDSFTTRAGKEIMLRHELKKLSDGQVDWIIFEKTDNDEWQRLYAMSMTK